ncbi:MAG TPA: glycoside hydrolase family 18 protein [Sediminibacterium sp.]|nr:glycoside hydrolase family 18 protein [Sediminibacterium sp.]
MKASQQLLLRMTCLCCFVISTDAGWAQKKPFDIFGYFAGRPTMIDSFPVEKLTHLCFSFTHLKGNRMMLMNARDSAALQHCVALKQRNPRMKVMVSMGGWTGCYSCSPVFATAAGRQEFAASAKKLLQDFGADGVDLDWEYPVVPGPPGHLYSPEDKEHFTSLIKTLRDTLGPDKEISFAAGGFTRYIQEAVDWQQVTPLVDRINLMTYDLITGYDTVTGHHTALYSTREQLESCDHAVRLLLAKGVPPGKLLIGAAFYARVWQNVAPTNNGLRQKGHFLRGFSYHDFSRYFSADSGYVYHWDRKTAAPYLYNPGKKWFVTFDDRRSLYKKYRYARRMRLSGLMFWQLADDRFTDGMLDMIAGWVNKQKGS